MVLVWSGATIACAFASGYAELLAARAVVGIGEAAYGAVGAALLASLFPSRMRSTILGAFLSASLVGSVLGVALGGVIADRYGWEWAFGLAGTVGLLLALLFVGIVRIAHPDVRIETSGSFCQGFVDLFWVVGCGDRDNVIVCRAAGQYLQQLAGNVVFANRRIGIRALTTLGHKVKILKDDDGRRKRLSEVINSPDVLNRLDDYDGGFARDIVDKTLNSCRFSVARRAG